MADEERASDATHGTVYSSFVPAQHPWSHTIKAGSYLRITDAEGQQAIDFLCYNASDLSDRYNAMNTIKVARNAFIGLGTVLYSDSGLPLFTVVEDSIGKHDTIYGCCSAANNRLRYGDEGKGSCYANFHSELAKHGVGKEGIVANVNWFMQVPISADGSVGVANDVSPKGSYVELRAERDVLAVLSCCPQMLNPCNGYRPSGCRVVIREYV